MHEIKIRDLAEKVNTIRLSRAEDQPFVEKLKMVTSSLSNDLVNFKKDQIAVAKEIENSKEHIADHTKELVIYF